jgi:hypothetical protein
MAMRILFLCSSLEPGRDGVGDYTRLLAEECVRQGQACALLALHDRNITAPLEESITVSPSPNQNFSSPPPTFPFSSQLSVLNFSPLPLLRLPATMPRPERTARAVAFRERFKPEWISLQFVPYGFQDKGIISGLTSRLRKIMADVPRLHIMFHELWIGAAKQSPFKHRLIGSIQRGFVLDMIRKLNPAVIHTHTPLYAAMLQQAGFAASILPLFGNIPVVEKANPQWLWDQLAAAGCSITDGNRKNYWLAGFFGTLHPQWEPEPFFSLLHRAAQKAGKGVCLLALGRLGSGETRWEQFACEYAKDFLFLKLGEQPPEKISQCLQAMDFGIAASPWQLIGKSSTAATMLDHGLPIIVTRNDAQRWTFSNDSTLVDPVLHLCDDSLEMKLITGLQKIPAQHQLKSVGKRLLQSFTP